MKTRRVRHESLRMSAGIFLFAVIFCYTYGHAAAGATADHLVINEIQTDGISGTGGISDDWVEIFNPTASAVSLSGWSLQKQSMGATSTIVKIALSGTIPAGGYYLAVRGDASQEYLALADLVSASLALSDNNVLYLADDNVVVSDKTDANIVDFVGWGAAENFEGTGAANNPSETQSIVREPDGDDTDNNFADYVGSAAPTPKSASVIEGEETDLEGSVLLTVILNEAPVINLGAESADIAFSANGAGSAYVNYGLTTSYGSVSASAAITANTNKIISLSGLACGTAYHYSVYAESPGGAQNDTTADASFVTLPCGLALDSLIMTKSSAKANNAYVDGWIWEFGITVWDRNETSLKMKFAQWTGAGSLSAGGNMQYSVDSTNWIDVSANGAYPDAGINIGAIDIDTARTGRQAKIFVHMKIPVATPVGNYGSNYVILAE